MKLHDLQPADGSHHARTRVGRGIAAGKGKRLKSARPKVLHPVCGKPALWHVEQTALAAPEADSPPSDTPKRISG